MLFKGQVDKIVEDIKAFIDYRFNSVQFRVNDIHTDHKQVVIIAEQRAKIDKLKTLLNDDYKTQEMINYLKDCGYTVFQEK